MKKIKFALIGAAMALMALATGKSAEAATMSPVPASTISQLIKGEGGIVQKTTYYRHGYCYRHPWRCRAHRVRVHSYCRRWRWECANRWGWHTRGFYRCERRHGC